MLAYSLPCSQFQIKEQLSQIQKPCNRFKKKKSLKHAKTKPLVKLIMFCLLADDKKSIGFKAFLCYINSHKHTSGNLHFSPIADGTVWWRYVKGISYSHTILFLCDYWTNYRSSNNWCNWNLKSHSVRDLKWEASWLI